MYRLKRMADLAQGKILDIGFADQPNPYLRGEVYGFDRCAVMCPPNYTATITGDVADLSNWDERFDTVIAGEVIEHLDHPIEFLDCCYQILKPGGTLILSTPNPYYPAMIVLEMLMFRKFFYFHEHVHIFLPRFLVRLMERQKFTNVKTYSGGIVFPGVTMPFPRPICYAIIYTGQRQYETGF